MKSLGAFLVVSCAVLAAACSGDSFEPPKAGGTGGGAANGGAAGTRSDGGSGPGSSGAAGISEGGSSGGQSSAGAAGGESDPGGAGGEAAGTGGGDPGGGAGFGGGGSGTAGAAGKGSSAGNAGAAGKSGNGGAAGKPGAAGGGGKAGGGTGAGAGGNAGSSGGGGSSPQYPTFVPSNTSLVGTFGDDTSSNVNFANGGTFDTGADCSTGSPLGTCAPAPIATGGNGTDTVPTACVCRITGNLKINDAKLVGPLPLVLIVNGDATVSGLVRVLSGTPAAAAPATGGPGIGGTFGSIGGRSQEPLRGEATLTPLLTGQDGQAVGEKAGGKGGGALQLSVRGALLLPETARIDAGGKAGVGSAVQGSGPGGGSGGGILLEASSFTLHGTVVANGASGTGGGATESTGQPGVDGTAGAVPAEGGEPGGAKCTTALGAITTAGGKGGKGAAGGIAAGPGAEAGATGKGCIGNPGTINGAPGGGGGGVGRIRFRSRVMAVDGVVSPSASQESIPNP